MNSTTQLPQSASRDGAAEVIIDAQFVRAQTVRLAELRASGVADDFTLVAIFFRRVLDPWYESLSNALDRTTGHLLYRLADFVAPADRARIMVCGLTSLETWRFSWERLHPQGIPLLMSSDQETGRLALSVS